MTKEINRNRFCVYLHKLKIDTLVKNKFYLRGTVVYVGSGVVERVKSKTVRDKTHLELWDNLEFEIVKDNLTFSQKFDEEQILIDTYKSTILNKCIKVSRPKILIYSDIEKHFKIDSTSPSGIRRLNTGSCGNLNRQGYWVIWYQGINIGVHRILYCLYHKTDLIDFEYVVDHIDRDKSNNNIYVI